MALVKLREDANDAIGNGLPVIHIDPEVALALLDVVDWAGYALSVMEQQKWNVFSDERGYAGGNLQASLDRLDKVDHAIPD